VDRIDQSTSVGRTGHELFALVVILCIYISIQVSSMRGIIGVPHNRGKEGRHLRA
jgi:hypothetical protein